MGEGQDIPKDGNHGRRGSSPESHQLQFFGQFPFCWNEWDEPIPLGWDGSSGKLDLYHNPIETVETIMYVSLHWPFHLAAIVRCFYNLCLFFLSMKSWRCFEWVNFWIANMNEILLSLNLKSPVCNSWSWFIHMFNLWFMKSSTINVVLYPVLLDSVNSIHNKAVALRSDIPQDLTWALLQL